MKPVRFKEANSISAKHQPEYLPLPAYRSEDGRIVTCWRFSFVERVKILFSGTIWLSILTFNTPLQPIKLDTIKPNLEEMK